MTLEPEEARRRFATARVARLATVRPDGAPHLVPVVFAVVGATVYSAVDAKPKRPGRQLQRLVNLRAEPRCSLLVDHYDDDWARLWWARADGRARVVEAVPDHPGIVALRQRYRPYADTGPRGPLIEVEVERWTGWAAAPPETG